MKKIIGIIFISLMFANIGFAEMKPIEYRNMSFKGKAHTSNYANTGINTICVDGYKFVAVRGTNAVSMVQFFEERDGKSLPVKC